MNTNKWIAMGGVVGFATVFATAACNHGADPGPAGDGNSAAVSLAFSGPDYSDNSVLICGRRLKPGTNMDSVADSKYGCKSKLEDPNRNDDCVCVNFGPNNPHGVIDATLDPRFDDLCPSEDLSNDGKTGDWHFKFTLYTKEKCDKGTGAVLNTDPDSANFQCYEDFNLAAQKDQGQVTESLDPGVNYNHIDCVTEHAKKDWDFTTCDIEDKKTEPVPPNMTKTTIEYDCGCVLKGGVCTGSSICTDVIAGCTVNPVTCLVTCTNTK